MSSVHLERILCPIDFSSPSDYALKHALMLAERYGATLHLIHVVEPVAALPETMPAMLRKLEERPVLMARIQNKLDNAVPADKKERIDIKTSIQEGIAFLEIIKTARKDETDLIVIATHGHTGLKHLLLGSTAEQVVRQAPCPVLSVRMPEDADGDDSIDIKKVLLPTDFSDFAGYALDYAVAMTQDFDAELYMLYIEETLPYISDDEDRHFPSGDEVAQHAKQLMGNQAERYEALEVHRFVGRGNPGEEISDFVKEKEIDLVVMSTHGYTGLKHVLLGSTTEKTVRLSPCPVLSIHHPEHEFVHP